MLQQLKQNKDVFFSSLHAACHTLWVMTAYPRAPGWLGASVGAPGVVHERMLGDFLPMERVLAGEGNPTVCSIYLLFFFLNQPWLDVHDRTI